MQINKAMIKAGNVFSDGEKAGGEKENLKQGSFTEILRETKTARMNKAFGEESKAPYAHLANNGVIEYNGVTFVCDYQNNRICLGDVTERKNCLNIPLSKGGALVVNKNNLGDLSRAIGMFSPEDTKRILAALAQYQKSQEVQQEQDEILNGIVGQ